MKRISIKKLNYLYEKIIDKKKFPLNFFSTKKNHLNLSVHLSRDHREFDIYNFNLIQDLISQEYLDLKSKKKRNAFQNYLLSLKESNYLASRYLVFVIFLDILKILKQIIDITGLFVITFIGILVNNLLNFKKKRKKLIQKRIFSIYYWNKKNINSATYYYPNILSSKNNLIYISSFANSRYISLGLLNSLRYKNFLSPANSLSIRGLLLSLVHFIHLLQNDCFLAIFKDDYSFLKFWVGWKKASEIFYSVLNFNTIKELTKISKDCEFISWFENQVTNRSFSLAVAYSKKKYNSNAKLASYFGTPFSRLNKKQYLPEISEFESGFWGNKFYFQDKDSLDEMNLYLKQKRMEITLKVVPKSMVRIVSNKKFQTSNINLKRDFTIFTHDSYWDLIACILALINKKNKNITDLRKSFEKNNLIYIRLHPSLRKEEAIKRLKLIKEIPINTKLEFINNREESIIDSIKYCSYCFFGLSSYINLALKLKLNVIAVSTSHIYENPIKSDLQNLNNLDFVMPW